MGINVRPVSLEIDEVQSLDRQEVALKKASAYYKKTKKTLFVEDVSLEFSALNGLPGTYIDSFSRALGNKGLISLLHNKNRKAVAITTLVYIWGINKYKVFEGRVAGTISEKEKGKGFGWDPIFLPNGSKKTFGEMSLEEKNKHSMRRKALEKLRTWLKKSL